MGPRGVSAAERLLSDLRCDQGEQSAVALAGCVDDDGGRLCDLVWRWGAAALVEGQIAVREAGRDDGSPRVRVERDPGRLRQSFRIEVQQPVDLDADEQTVEEDGYVPASQISSCSDPHLRSSFVAVISAEDQQQQEAAQAPCLNTLEETKQALAEDRSLTLKQMHEATVAQQQALGEADEAMKSHAELIAREQESCLPRRPASLDASQASPLFGEDEAANDEI